MLTRRQMLKRVTGAAAGALSAPMINRGRFRLFAGSTAEYSTRAIDLIKRATVIDMLSPFAISFSKQMSWFSNPDSFAAADIARFKDSGINVFHIAIGIGGREPYLNALRPR